MFRLAFALKKSVQEILLLPEWERYCWKQLFAYYGPLDWRREDYLFARVNQYQSTGKDPLKEFILFQEPADRKIEKTKQTEDELLASLGYFEDEKEN